MTSRPRSFLVSRFLIALHRIALITFSAPLALCQQDEDVCSMSLRIHGSPMAVCSHLLILLRYAHVFLSPDVLGHFERRISFGYDADLTQVRAEFDGEHLRITVPRRVPQVTYWETGA